MKNVCTPPSLIPLQNICVNNGTGSVCPHLNVYFMLSTFSSIYPILSEQRCLTLQGPLLLIRESSHLCVSHFQRRAFKDQLVYLEDLVSLRNDL